VKASILLVDDDPGSIQLLNRVLAGLGQLRFASNGKDALRLALESPPDLILLDAEMPGMSGFETCKALKAHPALVDIPVIFVTSHSEPAFEIAGFELGAADFITKPVNPPLVVARVKAQLRVKRMDDELRRIATIDVLTGIANRRRFDESLEREWRGARRSCEPLALLMIDVDHFKAFNDRYGHPAGDVCLSAVAQALRRAGTRPADLVARYGGEEFALLLPKTPRAGAEHVARQALAAIEALAIAHDASPTTDHITVSVGVACYDRESTCWLSHSAEQHSDVDVDLDALSPYTAVELLLAADQALYAAKRHGRAQASHLNLSDINAPPSPAAAAAATSLARPSSLEPAPLAPRRA